MENSNCNSNTIIPVTKTKVSGASQSHDSRDNALHTESTGSIAEDDINDVKVCDICGDIGYEEVLVVCAECNEGAEHIYCMQKLLEAVPTEDWFCEGCKLKQKESNQKKIEVITESQTVSSSGQDTGKQGICRNSSSKISGLGKLDIPSEKVQTQNYAQNSESSCKRQVGDDSGVPVSKKQAIECGNLAVNVCQPALKRNNSLKTQETNKADGCGVLPQIKSTVRPSYTRDGSFKMPEAGKSDSGTTSLPANSNNYAQNSESSCKRQVGDDSGAPVSKKQAIEIGYLAVNVCQPALKRNNSLKTQETNKADGCGVLPQIKSTVRPSYTRDGSFKMPEAGKSDSGTTSLPANSNTTPRPFSRENSFKTAETAKVKFLPSHSVAGLRSGVPLKASSKPNAVDENSNIASPRTGIVNSRPFSPRNSSIPVADSSGPPINRSGLTSCSRQTSVNSGLRSVGLSNSNDALPSFLLSSRSNNSSRVHSIFRSSTEAGSGNGAGQLPGTKGNMKSNHSRISFPASSSYLKDSQGITSRNSVVQGMLKQSAGKFLVDESRDERSDVDISASPFLIQGNCGLDESIPPAKGNLHLTAASAEQKSSTVVAKDIQPQKLASVELKGSLMAKETPKGSSSTKRVVKDNASTECLNVSESVKEDPDEINLKQMEGGLNVCELSHKDNTKQLPISASFEGDIGGLTFSDAPISIPLLMADIAGSSVLKDKLPEEENLSLIKESEVLTFGKEEHKSLDPTDGEHNVAVSAGEDPKSSTSSKRIFSISLKNQTNEGNPLKPSADMLVDKASRLKSTLESLIDNSHVVEASQRAATLQTMTNIVSEMVPGTKNSKEVKLPSPVKDKRSSDTSTNISNDVTGKPINGSSKDLFSLEGSIVKPMSPASVAQAFSREVSVAIQAEICMNKPSEIDGSSSALMQTHTFGPSEMTSLSVSASKDIVTAATLNGGFGFPQSKHLTRPASESFWRGGFKIIDKVGYKLYDGIQAYLANKASPKVYEVSRKFPSQLHLEQVQRCSAWPKRFKVTPPTDGDIAVYIFPTEIKRCQIPYFELLEVMIKQDLALRVYLEGAELLIFSSNHLPDNYHRMSGQMYLWGVFRSGIASADPQGSFPDWNYVGSKVPQVGPSSLLAKNNDMLPRQWTCMDNSGYSEGEEDMDVDMEGGREIGMAERPAPRPIPQLPHAIVNNPSQPSFPSSSKPFLSHCENSKLVLPTGSEIPPGFDRSPGISMNSSGKSTEAMRENSSILRLHEKVQEKEIRPGFRLPDGKELPNKSLLPESFSQGWNCQPSNGLESMVFPPGVQPASVKFQPPYRNFQPVFGPATKNPPRLALNHLPCTQHATLKSPPSSLECPPGFKAAFSNQILFSSDHPSGIKPVSAKPHHTLSDCRPGFQPSLKHSLSSSDCPPGIEPAAVMPSLIPSEHPAGVDQVSRNRPFSSSGRDLPVEPDAMKPPLSYSEYPPGFEPTSGNHSLSSSYRLPGSEPTAKRPLMSSIQCSPGFQPASGNRSQSSSDCPPSFELAADKSLLPSSVYPLKNLVSEQIQGSVLNDKLDPQPEVQYEIQPSRQRSTYLSPRQDDSRRSQIKANHAYESREFKYSHSHASIHHPLSYSDHPPAAKPVAMKPPPSISEYPPGCEPAFGNHTLPSSDSPPGNEPAAEKRPLSSTRCSPSFQTASGNRSFSSSDCLPSVELAAKNSLLPTSVHPLKHRLSVPLQDKHDLQPEVQYEIQPSRQRSAYLLSREDDSTSHSKADHAYENREFNHSHSLASIRPPLSSSDHPPAIEHVSMTPPPSTSEYPPGCEPAFGNHSLPSSDHPPGSQPAAEKHPLSSTHCSPSFEPVSGNCSLSSSNCPPSFGLAAENSLLPSSVHPLDHLVSVQVQDSVMKDKLDSQPEVQYGIQPISQCSAQLSSRENDSSKSHTKADHAHERREFKCSSYVASIHRPRASSDHPTSAEPVPIKPPLSNSECPPGLEPSFGKHSLPFSDCPPCSELTAEKHPLSSTQFSPGFDHASALRSLASSDYPPSFQLAAEKSLLPSSVHSVERLVSKHLQDKNNLEPEVHNEIRTSRQCSAYFSTREDNSRSHLKTDHTCGSREFNRSSFAPINHPLSSSDCPPSVEAATVKPPPCNSEYPLVSGNHSLPYSDCPLSFELAAEKSLLPSSVRPLKHLVSEQLQDSVMQDQLDIEPEFQNEIQQSRQHSPYLSSMKDGSRSHLKRDHAYRSKEFKRSRSLASMNTDVDRTRNSPWMCKSKSFKEELYNNSSKRRNEDRREGDTGSYREKEDDREGDKSSNREKESRRERGRSSSREMGDARKKARSCNKETESKRERGRSYSREKEDRRERGRNSSREKQIMRKGDREYAEREHGEARDSRHHRYHSRYSGTTRHKEHEKHSSSFSYCNSHSESTAHSYSPLRENGRKEATGNLLSRQQVKFVNSNSSIVNSMYKKPSLDKDSESGENDITNCLYKENAPLNGNHDRSCNAENYSAQLMKSESFSLEVKKKVSKIKLNETSADDDHASLWDLNKEATCNLKFSDEKSCGEATCQVPIQVNISDSLNSRSDNTSQFGQGERVIPEVRNWCAGSSSILASVDSLKCLPLFPFEDGDCGRGDITVNHWDFNLEPGHGKLTLNRETLPLLEKSSLQRHPCNFILDDGASTSRSTLIYDDSREASSTILSLSMPQYRKQGNSWVEVTKDIEQLDQNDAVVNLTLSLFS